MIISALLLITFLILTIIVVFGLGAGVIAFILVFGDVLVFILLIGFIIKRIRKK